MPEDIQSISSSRLAAAEIARHSFGTVRRGFDPQEVRAYLELVARELGSWEQHDQELRRQVAEAEERARNPVIDESTLTSALGQQSAQVLRSAHEEAARIALRAEETAAALVREAQRLAAEVRVQAESGVAERIAEAEIAVGSVRQQAQEEVADLLEASRREAEAAVARAMEQGQAIIEQAQETRRRVLADMAQRRRAMTLQIEQFRAARDELATSVLGVRQSVDRIAEDLSRADDQARAAASEVARRQPVEPGESELLGEITRAEAELDAELRSRPPVTGSSHAGSDDGTPRGEVGDGAGRAGGLSEGGTGLSEERAGLSEGGAQARRGGATEAVGVEPSTSEMAAADPLEVATAGGNLPATDAAVSTVIGAAGDPGLVDDDAVEGLFARLRASHPESAGPREAENGGEIGPAGTTTGTAAPVAPSPVGETDEGAAEKGHVGDDGGGNGSGTGDGSGTDTDGDPDAPIRSERTALLNPIVNRLARRMKRALQDDQNHLLDRLRHEPGPLSERVLVPEEEQRSRFVKASATSLREAVVAGHAFAGGRTGRGRGRVPSVDDSAAAEAAEGLATAVVTLLRRRLVEASAADSEGAAESVGAAYREWRGERIERLVGDYALGAFSSGVLAVAGEGSELLRWVVGGSGPACADCEDNALAGSVAVGEEFPTGHRHPPAHAGCRCLVALAPD